jgi:predicted transcriptional regulator
MTYRHSHHAPDVLGDMALIGAYRQFCDHCEVRCLAVVDEVLSDQNRALLKVIRETNPDSMTVLARATGRQPGNLSRTLKTMARYGLVDLQREKSYVRPVVTATEFRILAAA